MLNILVNDSFSTNNSKKKNKKKKKLRKGSTKESGFSALEILQMKEAKKIEDEKPRVKPVVYFKDFEKRFDELIVK